MARFSDEVRKAYKKRWSMINNFTVEIFPVGTGSITAVAQCGINLKDCQLNIKSIDLPQFSYDAIETWMVDRYRISQGKPTPKTVTVTFRDEDQMRLYRSFVYLLTAAGNGYPDDYMYNITVYKDGDYANEGLRSVFIANKAYISAVSQVQFSNDTEAQIAEFTVEFHILEAYPPYPR